MKKYKQGIWLIVIGALIPIIHCGWISINVFLYGLEPAHYIFPGTIDTIYSFGIFLVLFIIAWQSILSDMDGDDK